MLRSAKETVLINITELWPEVLVTIIGKRDSCELSFLLSHPVLAAVTPQLVNSFRPSQSQWPPARHGLPECGQLPAAA